MWLCVECVGECAVSECVCICVQDGRVGLNVYMSVCVCACVSVRLCECVSVGVKIKDDSGLMGQYSSSPSHFWLRDVGQDASPVSLLSHPVIPLTAYAS